MEPNRVKTVMFRPGAMRKRRSIFGKCKSSNYWTIIANKSARKESSPNPSRTDCTKGPVVRDVNPDGSIQHENSREPDHLRAKVSSSQIPWTFTPPLLSSQKTWKLQKIVISDQNLIPQNFTGQWYQDAKLRIKVLNNIDTRKQLILTNCETKENPIVLRHEAKWKWWMILINVRMNRVTLVLWLR